MANFLFVTDSDIYSPEEVDRAGHWSCSKSAKPGDTALVYLKGIGVEFEWAITSEAKPAKQFKFQCNVERVRKFDSAITIDELRDAFPNGEWGALRTNFRGLRSIEISDEYLLRILSLRSRPTASKQAAARELAPLHEIVAAVGQFAVIVENDESQWHDVTGVSYHFPRRYLKLLTTGTRFVYYKGRQKNARFGNGRLTSSPHYFGVGRIGRVYEDAQSTKGDWFAEVLDYRPFERPVQTQIEGEFLELIPASRQANYWRDGVRAITKDIYQRIAELAYFSDEAAISDKSRINDLYQGTSEALTSAVEGRPSQRMTTTYERNPKLRALAVQIHGTTCKACGFNFADFYGQHGAGFIHVHHIDALAEGEGEREVNATTDMEVLCANCHAMVHRYRDRTLSLDDLRQLIKANGWIRG